MKRFYFDAILCSGVVVTAVVRFDARHSVYVATVSYSCVTSTSSSFKLYFATLDELLEFCLSTYNNVHFSF